MAVTSHANELPPQRYNEVTVSDKPTINQQRQLPALLVLPALPALPLLLLLLLLQPLPPSHFTHNTLILRTFE